jgi:hypothetical protein
MEKSSKNLISLFGEMPARGLPKPPPSPPRLKSAELTRGKRADSGRGHEFQTRIWKEGMEGRGENNAKRWRSLTDRYFAAKLKIKIVQTILLHTALKKCAYLLWLSFVVIWRFYIVEHAIKGSPSQQPALRRLHYILQSTPL